MEIEYGNDSKKGGEKRPFRSENKKTLREEIVYEGGRKKPREKFHTHEGKLSYTMEPGQLGEDEHLAGPARKDVSIKS